MAPPVTPAVRVAGLRVRYGRRTVVDGVDLTVAPGGWLAVIGPNGAGKSSLLRAIAGLVGHDGEVELAGGARPAYVAQRPALPPGMSVAEYVLLGRSPHLAWFEAEGPTDRRIVDEVLARMEIEAFAARPVTELSGGEIQRVTLARALAQRSPVLLLDEPTSALDIGHQIAVLELVDELRRTEELTVITALHDLDAAGRFADRLALMDGGAIVAEGAPGEVLTEATLSRYYRTEVEVLTGPDGRPVIVPLRTRHEEGEARPRATQHRETRHREDRP